MSHKRKLLRKPTEESSQVALQLSYKQRQAILAHAESTYPDECCGLLLGKLNQTDAQSASQSALQSAKVLLEVWQTENCWQADLAMELESLGSGFSDHQDLTKSNFYWIDPQAMLTAQRHARDRQMNIIGIYHSHPDHPAMPSERDRALAWTQYSYIIVSVQQGITQDIRCWSLDDAHQFQSEEIMIVDSISPERSA